jgi:hypothetical protein
MARLEDNLELCLKAVGAAKEAAKRSANQTYFKPGTEMGSKARNEFLLSCTRGSNYTKSEWENKQTNKTWFEYDKDPVLTARRKKVAELMGNPNLTTKQKATELDRMRKFWGQDYFWNRLVSQTEVDFNMQNGRQRFLAKMSKYTGHSTTALENMTDEEMNVITEYFEMKRAAASARKFGVGNCDEKGSLVAEYLVDHSPGGRVLACCFCDPEHLGFTGRFMGTDDEGNPKGGGDHVFCVYDMETPSTSVNAWGPNAIIADGWMNDAYPAQHHLKWKYGYNYNDKRINLKQLTIRNMICVSYRNHIKTRYRWNLTQGAKYGT